MSDVLLLAGAVCVAGGHALLKGRVAAVCGPWPEGAGPGCDAGSFRSSAEFSLQSPSSPSMAPGPRVQAKGVWELELLSCVCGGAVLHQVWPRAFFVLPWRQPTLPSSAPSTVRPGPAGKEGGESLSRFGPGSLLPVCPLCFGVASWTLPQGLACTLAWSSTQKTTPFLSLEDFEAPYLAASLAWNTGVSRGLWGGRDPRFRKCGGVPRVSLCSQGRSAPSTHR